MVLIRDAAEQDYTACFCGTPFLLCTGPGFLHPSCQLPNGFCFFPFLARHAFHQDLDQQLLFFCGKGYVFPGGFLACRQEGRHFLIAGSRLQLLCQGLEGRKPARIICFNLGSFSNALLIKPPYIKPVPESAS